MKINRRSVQEIDFFHIFVAEYNPKTTIMNKKKGGKRVTKKQLVERLQTFFQENPNETFSFKQIFRALRLVTHPAKMLAIDTMEEMAWDDYLSKVSENSYRLNLKTQVQEGTFVRKANGTTVKLMFWWII